MVNSRSLQSRGELSGSELACSKENLSKLSIARALYLGYMKAPHKQMIIDEVEGMTYAEAWRKANVLAWYFCRECHVTEGSYIAVSARNDVSTPMIMAAAQMCGANIVSVPPELAYDELKRYLSCISVRAFLSSSERSCDYMKRIDPSCELLSMSGFRGPITTVSEASSRHLFGSNWEFPSVQGDRLIVLFSSGSTGTPKAIANRSSSFGRNGASLAKAFSLSPDDVIFLPVPFAHVFGIVGMYASLCAGATIVTAAKYRPETALALMSDTRATIHMGVATMYLRELRENQDGEWSLSTLRAGLVAGAGCPESVFSDFERLYGCRVAQSYGMTETAATLTTTSLDLPCDVRAHCVGVPIEGASIALDPATHEILCKTPSLMEGVLQSDGSCKLDLDDEGWFHTGDVGDFDEGGRLRIVGRIKDIVIRGGINIFPAEVERLYEQCPDVTETCMVGYSDPELGERTCLCAVPSPHCTASALELREFAVGKIEKCRIPDVVMKMDDLPRLANGKIDKKALRTYVNGILGA